MKKRIETLICILFLCILTVNSYVTFQPKTESASLPGPVNKSFIHPKTVSFEKNKLPNVTSSLILSKEAQAEVPEETYQSFEIPDNVGFKSFTYYTAFGEKSNQYALQCLAYTGDYGIRMVEDRYCVAVGTHFGMEIGQCFDLVLENGTIIPCVLSDVKSDAHTDVDNIITLHNGCVSEFTIDKSAAAKEILRNGDVSFANENWDSSVSEIRVYEKNLLPNKVR